MLEGLDDIAWDELVHAYGPATTVPDRIRAVASMRGAAQENAIDTLGNEICHQGSSYSSTAPTVPFPLEIVRQPQIPRRDRLVALLLTIAVGLDSDLLDDQTKLSEYIAKQERDAAGWPKSRPRPVSWGPFIWLECYSSVRRAVPTLIRLLDDRSRGVRIHTAYLLAWFPSECHKSLPPLRRLMNAARRWDELANAILSVGLLEWQASVRSQSRTFVRPLLDDRREAVRYAAAVYLSWHEPAPAVKSVLQELSERDDYNQCAPLPFNGYDWSGFAAQQLAVIWGERREE
jgi:hypothetical protein